MANRPIQIMCCYESPEYDAGPMTTCQVSHTPTIVLEDLLDRIALELEDRRRIKMLLKEQTL